MTLVTLNMSPLGKRVNFTTLLGLTITLFLVLFQAPAAQASNEIAIFLVSKNKNATVEDALLSVPIFGKILGDKLENQTLIIQQKKEENLIFFLGSAKAYPKTRTELSVVSANTEYSFNISSKAFRKRRAKSDEPWKTINLIELYNNDEIKKLLEEVANLKEQLEQTSDEAIESRKKKTELEQDLADLEGQLKSSQLQHDKEKNELSKKTAELVASRDRALKASEGNAKRVSELEALSSNLSETINYQRGEINSLKLRLETAQNRQAPDQSAVNNNEVQLAKLEKEILLKSSQIEELEAKLSTNETSSSETTNEQVIKLEKTLEAKAQEVGDLQNKIAELESQTNELTTANKTLSKELAEAKSNASSSNEVKSLRSKIEDLETDIKNAKLALKQTEERNLQLSQAVAALASGNSPKDAEVGGIEQTLETKEKQACFDAIQNNLLNPETLKTYEFDQQTDATLKVINEQLGQLAKLLYFNADMQCLQQGHLDNVTRSLCVAANSDGSIDEIGAISPILTNWIENTEDAETFLVRYKAQSKGGNEITEYALCNVKVGGKSARVINNFSKWLE